MRELTLRKFKELELEGKLLGKYVWSLEDRMVTMDSHMDTIYISSDTTVLEINREDLTGFKISDKENTTVTLVGASEEVLIDCGGAPSILNSLVQFCSEVDQLPTVKTSKVVSHPRKKSKKKSRR